MKRVSARTFTAAIIFLLVWITFMGCRRDEEVAQIPADTTQLPLMMAFDIEVIFSDSGHLQARVTGPVVNRYEGEKVWLEFAKGFKAEMFDSAQRLETTITADYGKRLESVKTMEARGNVIVRNEFKNEQLNTEVLIWNEMRHTISTDSPVIITTPDKVLYGTGLESNETFTNYRILRPRGEMQVKEDSI